MKLTYGPKNTEQQNIMMQRTANENAACLRRVCKRSDQPKIERLAMILLRDSFSVRSFLIAAMTRYSGFFLLFLVTRFACDIGQLAKIWI